MAIRLRRGLDSDRLTVLLEQGEIAYTTDTKKLYIGDGVTLGGNGVSSSATSLITEGRNSTGSTLYKGTIIRIQGSTGALPNFVKAQGNSDANSAQTFGVIMNDIANNANGFVVTNGAIDTLDTRSTATHPFTDVTLADGDLLYLHPTIAGYVTNVKPYAPQHLVYVGVITRTSPTAGTIVYRIQNGYELDELHDVAAQTPSNNDGLFYESSTSLWKNKSISTVLGFTPIPLTGLSASSPLAYNNTTGAFSIQVANGSQNGYLSSTDWTTFNGKQATISLTTTGNSGASTFAANVLNIPTYTLSGLGGQPLATNLTSISALTFASTSFVKMTAAGTFALDTNTYLTAESDTLASVTGRGNSTTNAITVGGLTVATNLIYTDTVNGRVGIGTASPTTKLHILGTSDVSNGVLRIMSNSLTDAAFFTFGRVSTTDIIIGSAGTASNLMIGTAQGDAIVRSSSGKLHLGVGYSNPSMTFMSGGNIGINTTTDAGFRLDVNGTARIQGEANVSFLTLNGSTAVNNSGTTLVLGASGAWAGVRVPRYFETTGSITAASAIARGVYMNQTLVAAANNDVLVGLDIAPTFTNGAFTGVVNYGIRNSSKTTLGDILSITGGGNTPLGLGNGLHLNFSSNIGSIQSLQTGVQGRQLNIMGNPILFGSSHTGIFYATLFGNGNLTLQNGGTFTDAGFRLDVVGADSRFNGIRAGLGAGQVATNTVFGNGALNANTTGSFNTAIGYQSMSTGITTGSGNVALGDRTLTSVTGGRDNMAIGSRALTTVRNGAENVGIGLLSLSSIDGSISNTAIGSYSLQNNAASGNTAIGWESLKTNTSGFGLVSIGYQALSLSTGNFNTAVGYQSLSAHTTGTNNTALGHLTASGNFSGCLILGKDATATANNQFVVGSSTVNAGAVTTAVGPVINEYWTVIINGVSKKIALIA